MEQTITELINSVGFPIIMCLAFAKYIQKRDEQRIEADKEVRKQMNLERDKLIKAIEENRRVNEALLSTNMELAETNRILVSNVDDKMNTMENTLIKIEENLNIIQERKLVKTT